MVPLHFLNPGMELPVVPLYTNGFGSPMPLATRCLSLGQMVRAFIDSYDGNERIALVASGVFAGDVGGPLRGWNDTEWIEEIRQSLEAVSTSRSPAKRRRTGSTPPATTPASC